MYVFIWAERCSTSFVRYKNWPLYLKKNAEIIVWNGKKEIENICDGEYIPERYMIYILKIKYI